MVWKQPFYYIHCFFELGVWTGRSREGLPLLCEVWDLSYENWSSWVLESCGKIITHRSGSWNHCEVGSCSAANQQLSHGLLPRLQLPHSVVASEESDFLPGSKADAPANSKTKATWLFLILPHKSCGATFRVFYWLHWLKQWQTCPHSKGNNHPPSQPHGRNVRDSLLYNTILFNSQTIIFWGSMNIIPILQMGTLRFREAKESKHLYSKAWAPNHTPKTHCLAFMMPSLALDAPQNHPQPKFQDPPFLTSFCWFTCSEFPSVLEVANDTSTSIPSSPALGPKIEISRKAAPQIWPICDIGYLWLLMVC